MPNRKSNSKKRKKRRHSKHTGLKILTERTDVNVFSFDKDDLDVTELYRLLQTRLARGTKNYLVLFERGGNQFSQRFRGEKWIFFDNMDPTYLPYEDNIYIKCDITFLPILLTNLQNCFHYITSDYNLLLFTDDVLSWMIPSLLPEGIIAFSKIFKAEGPLHTPHIESNEDSRPFPLRISTGYISIYSYIYGLIRFFIEYPHPDFDAFINWYKINESCISYYLYMREPQFRKLVKTTFPLINRTLSEQLSVTEERRIFKMPDPVFINCPSDDEAFGNISTVIEDMKRVYEEYCQSWKIPDYTPSQPTLTYIIKKPSYFHESIEK